MTQISIMWEGPISVKKAKNLDKDSDIGLYQLYGRHPIFGRDSLLYIGHTFDSFAQRSKAHVGSHPDMGEVLHDETRWKGAVGYFREMYCGRLFPPRSESVTCGELKKLIVEKKEKLKELCGEKTS